MTRPSDELLLSALAAGSSVEDAARTADVSARTAYRRLKDPRFAARLAQARDELISAALGELVECASEAVATLRSSYRRAMKGSDWAPPRARSSSCCGCGRR